MAMMSCRLSIGWFVIVLIKDTSLVSLWLKRPWATTCVTPPKKHTHKKKTLFIVEDQSRERSIHMLNSDTIPKLKCSTYLFVRILIWDKWSGHKVMKRSCEQTNSHWEKKKKQDRKNNKRSFLQAQKDWTANSKSLLPRLRPPLWPLR